MTKSMSSRVLHFVRRNGTVTSHDVADEFKIEFKVASACLCDLRIRKMLQISGKTTLAATGRPLNLWSVV